MSGPAVLPPVSDIAVASFSAAMYCLVSSSTGASAFFESAEFWRPSIRFSMAWLPSLCSMLVLVDASCLPSSCREEVIASIVGRWQPSRSSVASIVERTYYRSWSGRDTTFTFVERRTGHWLCFVLEQL